MLEYTAGYILARMQLQTNWRSYVHAQSFQLLYSNFRASGASSLPFCPFLSANSTLFHSFSSSMIHPFAPLSSSPSFAAYREATHKSS